METKARVMNVKQNRWNWVQDLRFAEKHGD